MSNFYISETTQYEVECESCCKRTGLFSTWEEADCAASDLGFKYLDTPDDGTLNFCKECAPEYAKSNQTPAE